MYKIIEGKNMRKLVITLAMTMLAFGLSGCGKGQTADIKSLTLGENGEITHHVVGSLDQDYYQIEMSDLEGFVAERVEEYCSQNGQETVVLESAEEKNGSIRLDFRYASPEDYSGFNYRKLYVGTLADAGDAGYELEAVPFISTEGKPSEVGYIEDWDKKQLIVLETKSGEEMLVNLPGKTLYVNQDAHNETEVTLVGKKSVKISNQEEAGTTSLSYIIYE